MAALVTHVAVRDEQGVIHSFGPGSEIPAWAAKLITNPAVWEGGAGSVADPAGDGGQQSGGAEPPPRAGKGSGEDKWRAYAAEKGVELPAAVESRDDVIEFLEAAGIPVG